MIKMWAKCGRIEEYKNGNNSKENGNNAVDINAANREENKTVLRASEPFPCFTNLWPGKTVRIEESSGIPKNIEGMKQVTE